MKKITIIVLVMLLLTASLFAGCAKTEEAPSSQEAADKTSTSTEEPVTINFMTFSANEGGQLTLELMKELFENEYPNITVNIEIFGYDTYATQLQTRVGGGDAPDCFEIGLDSVTAYVQQEAIIPLNDMMAATSTDLTVLTEKSLEAFTNNGSNYAMPYSYSTVILIYNKDLFDEAGQDYPKDDWTWDDADAAAAEIAALGDEYFGLIQPISSWEFFKVVEQYGGSLLSDDGNAFTVNSEENIIALERMVDNVLVTNIAPRADQMGSLDEWGVFKLGKTGMIATGIWAFPSFTTDCDFEWDICVEPGGTEKATHYFANGLCVSSDSPNAEAAYKWIEFLSTSEEVAKLRVQLGWELPCASYDSAISNYTSLTPPENKMAVFKSLDYVVSMPKVADWGMMADILQVELQAAAAGDKTPKQALDDAQEALEAAISLQ